MKKVIKVGDLVKWRCLCPAFIAEGIVRKIGVSTFGSCRETRSLQIEVLGESRKHFPNRKTTTISEFSVLEDKK
jgi:hypothetical protein